MFSSKIINTIKTINFSPLYKSIKINNSIRSAVNVHNIRTLYSKSSLGLDGFEQTCQNTQRQLQNMADKFKDKIAEYMKEDSKHMVFTEDLKNMIHISTNDNDLELVVKMIKKFNQQNKELRFGSFVFGPVVMRLFHHLNKPDVALECFKSQELDGFFDQIASYQILLNLLFENQMYQEILDCAEIIKQKQLEGIRHPKNVVVLTFAACYKLNNKESLEYALKLWQTLKEVGHYPMRRATTFCAALVYNQGNPGIAIEILTSAKNQSYTTVRNIKVAALADLGRWENVMPLLKGVLTEDAPSGQKHTFNKEVINKIKEAIALVDNPEVTEEFNKIEQLLINNGHIQDSTLDEQLCQEIKSPMIFQKRNFTPRYNQDEGRPRRTFTPRRYNRQRPGLEELV